jgi:hypothetical protein
MRNMGRMSGIYGVNVNDVKMKEGQSQSPCKMVMGCPFDCVTIGMRVPCFNPVPHDRPTACCR